MADTKLSNTYTVRQLVNEVPGNIDKYTKEVHGEVDKIRDRSIYYAKPSSDKILGSVLLAVTGILLIFRAGMLVDLLPEFMGDTEGMTGFCILTGILLLFVAAHLVCRMSYSGKLKAGEKRLDEIGEAFKTQYEAESNGASLSVLMNAINNSQDLVLEDDSKLDRKLFQSISDIQKSDKSISKLVMASRFAVPSLFFLMAFVLLLRNENEILWNTLALVCMFICNSRLCLLLDYRTGGKIRALLCIPSVVYGIVAYATMRRDVGAISFVAEGAAFFTESAFLIALLQVAVLVLLIIFRDYYREKKNWREGISHPGGKDGKRSNAYVAMQIVIYSVLMCVFINYLIFATHIVLGIDEMGQALLFGAVYGVIWRLISPAWPVWRHRTIQEFWGMRYSIVVDVFMMVLVFSCYLMSGFVFNYIRFVIMAAMIISSCIVFAILNHH